MTTISSIISIVPARAASTTGLLCNSVLLMSGSLAVAIIGARLPRQPDTLLRKHDRAGTLLDIAPRYRQYFGIWHPIGRDVARYRQFLQERLPTSRTSRRIGGANIVR